MSTAPLILHTGKPGNGKTLYTLWHVKQRAEKEGRAVYYSGIKDLKLPWIEIEPEKWYEAPPGAIIVIDEAQRVFRPRANGSQVPKHVEAAETLRHNGHDLYLITQDPRLIDANLRRLCGLHRHMVRAFGAQFCNIHEFSEVRDNVDKHRSGSIETKWSYPKEIYSYYTSAEVHTIKRNIPARVFFLLLFPFLLAIIVYYFYQWYSKGKTATNASSVSASAPAPGTHVGPHAPAVDDPGAYIKERSPRIDNQPWTAPVYDNLTQAQQAPTPVACVQNHDKGTCRCFDQQNALMRVSVDFCESYIRDGAFIPWREPAAQPLDRRDNRIAQVDQPGQDHRPSTAPDKLMEFSPPPDRFPRRL